MIRPTRRFPGTTAVAVAVAVVGALWLAALPVAAADTLHEGRWTKKRYAIEGTWKIVEDGGKRWLILDDAFKTKNAPDLKLFLSTRSVSDLGDDNALSNAVRVALLAKNRGGQRYEIPAGVDLSRYRTLVLHCEKYSKLWGVAPLH